MSKNNNSSFNPDLKIPDVMQAVVSSGKGFENLSVKDIAVPEITANQLLARVDAAGVSVFRTVVWDDPQNVVIYIVS